MLELVSLVEVIVGSVGTPHTATIKPHTP